MSVFPHFLGMGQLLLAGLAGPGLGLVVQGHLPGASPWSPQRVAPMGDPAHSVGAVIAASAGNTATTPFHPVAAGVGALHAGGQS